jgi:hypothetical protein
MPKYVIEREIPGAGNLSPQELQAVSQTFLRSAAADGPEHSMAAQLRDRR